MKHQITLVGGQLLPVYLGIKEFAPEYVHFLYSKESKKKMSAIKKMLPDLKFSESLVDAFDLAATKAACERLLDKLEESDEVIFNLTGGTKIMMLAMQAVIIERGKKGIYINQNNTLLNLPEYNKSPLGTKLLIEDFLKLSGHTNYTANKLDSYLPKDIKAVTEIETFANNNRYQKITEYVRNQFKKSPLPTSGSIVADRSGRLKCTWTKNTVEIFLDDKSIHRFASDKILDLFFKAGWWEVIVAKAIAEKMKPSEILLNVTLPFIADNTSSKSEIDILINNNNKLMFIECKSGTVKAEDINKMRIIKETYGGLVSKSVLVTQFPVSDSIREKCDELDIEVFVAIKRQFQLLVTRLNKLEKSASL